MKKAISILTLFSLIFILTNCSSDKPDNLPVSLNGSAAKSFTLISAANATQSVEVTFNLSDFSGISEYLKYVGKGNVLATSFIEVSGITSSQSVNLTNISLEMKSDRKKTLKLNDIDSNTKIIANTASELVFLQNIMDEIVGSRSKSSTVILKYTPTTNMTNESNKLTIHFNTQFTFK